MRSLEERLAGRRRVRFQPNLRDERQHRQPRVRNLGGAREGPHAFGRLGGALHDRNDGRHGQSKCEANQRQCVPAGLCQQRAAAAQLRCRAGREAKHFLLGRDGSAKTKRRTDLSASARTREAPVEQLRNEAGEGHRVWTGAFNVELWPQKRETRAHRQSSRAQALPPSPWRRQARPAGEEKGGSESCRKVFNSLKVPLVPACAPAALAALCRCQSRAAARSLSAAFARCAAVGLRSQGALWFA